MATALFYLFGALAVAAAILVVSARSPVASALYLILALFCLAGLYVLLGAHFVAAVHVLVYAGAIMVLFLFVIMLLNLREELQIVVRGSGIRGLGSAAVVVYCGLLLHLLRTGSAAGVGAAPPSPDPALGATETVARLLFTRYLLPFELTSVILLVAMIGAIVLSKRDLP